MEQHLLSYAESGQGIEDLRPMLAVHIRAGSDFVRACHSAVGKQHYFASGQCASARGRRSVWPAVIVAHSVVFLTYNANAGQSQKHCANRHGKTTQTT